MGKSTFLWPFMRQAGGFLSLFVTFALTPNSARGEPCPEDLAPIRELVVGAARRDLPPYLEVASTAPGDFGFLPGEDVMEATTGVPIPIYEWNREQLARPTSDATPCEILDRIGEWMVPVTVGGAYRAVFGVRLYEDGWHGVYLGNPYLAATLETLRTHWTDGQGLDAFRLISSIEPRGFVVAICDEGEKSGTLAPATRLVFPGGVIVEPAPLTGEIEHHPDLLGLFADEIRRQEAEEQMEEPGPWEGPPGPDPSQAGT